MTADTLKRHTCKDLARMAKQRGVRGWHGMRKNQLVQALLRAARKKAASRNGHANGRTIVATARRTAPVVPAVEPTRTSAANKASQRSVQQIRHMQAQAARLKDLASTAVDGEALPIAKDRLAVMVRDPFWLHVFWELSRVTVERARAALSQEWHTAKPVLRLFEVSEAGATMPEAETLVRHVEIHGGVNNWYIDVADPPKTYRVEIGYRAVSGRFFTLARSNTVSTPRPGSSDAIDRNWTDVTEDLDRIFAMSAGFSAENPSMELQELFEERLRRPINSPLIGQFGPGTESLLGRSQGLFFELDAELLVYGATEPTARVTVHGEPIRLRADGTFTMRFSLPNCRQVIPAIASSSDGLEQRTVVLAVERNTKSMEPLVREMNE